MRKEINLSEEVLVSLQQKADKKKWSLKKYMEQILIKDAEKNNIRHNSSNLGSMHAGG